MDSSRLVATTGSSDCGFPHKTSSNTQNIVSAKQPRKFSPATETEAGGISRIREILHVIGVQRESTYLINQEGDNLQRNNISATLESGSSFQVLGKLIYFKPL